MSDGYFGLVLLAQVLAVYEHVVEKPDTWQWWVLICTQTSNESTFFPDWWFMARFRYRIRLDTVNIQHKWLLAQVLTFNLYVTFAALQVTVTSSEWKCWRLPFVCSCVWMQCESDRGTECSSESKPDVLWMWVCMWVRFSFLFLQKKLDTPSPDRRTSFIFVLNYIFSLSVV